MPLESGTRLDLGCLVGNLEVTVVTRSGMVYQGIIQDWDCGRATYDDPSCSSPDTADSASPRMKCEGYVSFIRLSLTCLPGNICCPLEAAGASRVTPILGYASSTDSLFVPSTIVLINWDDISAIGPDRPCLTTAPNP